jgi:hypothetical protein
MILNYPDKPFLIPVGWPTCIRRTLNRNVGMSEHKLNITNFLRLLCIRVHALISYAFKNLIFPKIYESPFTSSMRMSVENELECLSLNTMSLAHQSTLVEPVKVQVEPAADWTGLRLSASFSWAYENSKWL